VKFLKVSEMGNQVTNFKEQSPSLKANGHSASQEIIRLLWNPKVQSLVNKGLPLVQNLPHYFSRIHSNITHLRL